MRSSPHAPHVDTDYLLDGKHARVIAKLPENGDDGFQYPVDDSLAALEVAIAQSDGDPNAVTAAMLQRENRIDGAGGGSSGRKAKSAKPASMLDRREAQRARMAGHDEIRMGRPLKGAERRENFSTSIDPRTRRVLRENGIALSDVLDEIAEQPEVRALHGVGTDQGAPHGD